MPQAVMQEMSTRLRLSLRGTVVDQRLPFTLGSLVGRSVRASTLFMDHSLDESELDCRASYRVCMALV
jgi:hypothetical protein